MTHIGDCWGQNNYDPEFHRDMGNKQCLICGRLFSEHSREEFCNHLQENRSPRSPARLDHRASY